MITKNIIMGQLIKQEPKAYEILTGFGMHCLGCPSSQMESLEDACMVHGIDVDKVLEKLNENHEGVCNVFLDDIVGAIAAAACSKIAHNHESDET